MYTVVMSLSYILPKRAKTRQPKDEHCVSQCTHISYIICDAIPLDNLKNHTALPFTTKKIILHAYRSEILQLCIGHVTLNNKVIEYQCDFFVVPGNGPALLGMSDCEWLQLLTVNCQTIDGSHKGHQIIKQTGDMSKH